MDALTLKYPRSKRIGASAKEPARIMVLPGSVQVKYSPEANNPTGGAGPRLRGQPLALLGRGQREEPNADALAGLCDA